MAQSAQELLNLNLINSHHIDLDLVADNPQFPWNSTTLSLNRKLTEKFIHDHPELPWDKKILSSRFYHSGATQLTTSINNKPEIPLVELSSHKFYYGQLLITVTFHVINGSQGVILAQFDNEFYYFCQLDIDGNNPRLIPDDKRTLELPQLDQIHVDYLAKKLLPNFRSTWDENYSQYNMKSLLHDIKKHSKDISSDADIEEHKSYVLSKLESEPVNIHTLIVRRLCESEYIINIHYVINSILKCLVDPEHRIDSIDLSHMLLTLIKLDYSINEKIGFITQFVNVTNTEGYDDPKSCSIVTSIREMLCIQGEQWIDLKLSVRYSIVEWIIKTNCSAIIEDLQYH